MNRWTKWINVDIAKTRNGPFDALGIYQIRAVNRSGKAIPISRLAGVDPVGLLYVGRSGYKYPRTIANRIREFLSQHHSGGTTYIQAKKVMSKIPKFAEHGLQVRIQKLSASEIRVAESQAIAKYFSKYAELPPCNSAKPGK